MKKINLLLALFVCSLGASALVAEPSLRGSAGSASLGDGGVANSGTSVNVNISDSIAKPGEKVKILGDEKQEDSSSSQGGASLPNGKAYVGVSDSLSIRDSAWGNITGSLSNNDEVTIEGREGDWYKVSTNKGSGYVHSSYIFSKKDQRNQGTDVYAPNQKKSSPVAMKVSGDSIQAKVISAADNLVKNYATPSSFPYDPLTQGGSLGCAQVVSTALKAAGVIQSTDLSCYGVMGKLEAVGWSKVSAPPYQAGDVIFWSTYDSNGDGANDPNTHIGIVMQSGNGVQAMSNSSSQKKPRYHDAEYAPVTTVMRRC